MDIKKLAAALGLPETATEEEVLAAIKAMQDREAQAAAEAANAKAEEFADNAVKAGKIAANSQDRNCRSIPRSASTRVSPVWYTLAMSLRISMNVLPSSVLVIYRGWTA